MKSIKVLFADRIGFVGKLNLRNYQSGIVVMELVDLNSKGPPPSLVQLRTETVFVTQDPSRTSHGSNSPC